MKLFLVRHGETKWNHENRLQGQKNSPLTEKGLKQIKEMALFFSEIEIDFIYSSPLERAKQTAEEIAKLKKKEIVFFEELREISFGIMEGLTKEEIHGIFPGLWEKRHEDKFHFRIPEGESYFDLTRRAEKFLKKLKEMHSEKNHESILVVSHGCMTRAILGCLAKEVPKHEIANLGVSHEFVYEIEFEKEPKIFNLNIKTGKKSEGLLGFEVMNGKND